MKIFLFFLCVVSALAIPRLYQKATHGFRLAKCQIEWPFVPAWEMASPPLEKQSEIFSQPFTYFAKGRQSFVFQSRDEKYVLKLFRFDSSKIPYGQKIAKALRKWGGGKLREEVSREEQVRKTLGSCAQIFAKGAHLSQLILVHLNPQKEKGLPSILLKDSWGRSLRLDPAKDRYIVQRKGEIFFKKLKQVQGDKEPLLQAYLQLLDELAQQGFVNTDLTLGRNFGYVEGEVFLLDVGNLIYDREQAAANKAYFTTRLAQWLEKR